VIACIGHDHCPRIPGEADGILHIEEFKGDVIHSAQIGSFDEYN